MRIVILILVGCMLVYGMRRYTVNWAISSMEFGCREASLFEARNLNVDHANFILKFCDKRTEQVKEEWKW